ncbi:glutathione S-transferase [Penaeus vannamei]|uniref:Glutathione S-transferase n=2 Tax=Penaeus vannamei TaxID=6689 RepID=A0A3R7NZF3_PENVA|nr:glutathione S-transferase [Penaeus vannamei]
MFFGQEKVDPTKLEKLHEALGWLDGFLAGHDWAVGNSVTVADFVLVASVSTFEVSGIDLSKHRNVTAWLARCKNGLRGYHEANTPGVNDIAKIAKKLVGK